MGFPVEIICYCLCTGVLFCLSDVGNDCLTIDSSLDSCTILGTTTVYVNFHAVGVIIWLFYSWIGL